MNRFNICEAYWLYDTFWGPTPYGARLHRIGFRPGAGITLEKASSEVKAIYGRLVREHNRLYVAFERFARRKRNAPRWPGSYNMRKGERAWLKSEGILDAVDCYA